jgi:hypothetical protein
MSRGLGEVQIQALRGFLWRQGIDESWCTLRCIKKRAWGDRRDVSMFPSFNLRQSRKSGDSYKANHHSSFKRALELLVKNGYLEARNFRLRCSRRLTPYREYRLTERGKCALSKVNTYKAGAGQDREARPVSVPWETDSLPIGSVT